jgi:hypothetical protein
MVTLDKKTLYPKNFVDGKKFIIKRIDKDF